MLMNVLIFCVSEVVFVLILMGFICVNVLMVGRVRIVNLVSVCLYKKKIFICDFNIIK